MPPALLENTGADAMLRALEERFPVSLAFVRSRCEHFYIVLNSDSGKSCLRLARLLGALAAPCRMHQLCLSLTHPLRLGGMA
eukprot:15096693-Alexandrium_andersonii.AAC.1